MSKPFRWFLPRVLLCTALCSVTALPVVVAPASAEAATRKLGDRTLRMGDSGTDVKQLQELLTSAGVKVKADGNFGAGTKAAVQRFQRAAYLQASGVVGPTTIAKLRAAAGGAAATVRQSGGFDSSGSNARARSLGDRIPVVKGMSGHDVKVLQDFLRRAGMKRVAVDGEFGGNTLRAVRSFEKVEKLPVDGRVDANDIDVLRGLAGAGGTKKATAAPAPLPLAPGDRAKITSDGLAMAPANAPEAVKQIIAAGNKIAKTPYIYGGGHGKWEDKGYDCSGSVSYALHGANLLKAPLVSGDFPDWGESGPGQWITIYGNSGHVYMVVAGLRFDTSGAKQDGSRWHTSSRPTTGYGVSHPVGL
jgi:peptidoglycan hydrolase-like protein with peptidoglycan-binding domain